MNQTDNKALLLEAVDDYDVYSGTKRDTLKALINLSIHGVARITPTALSKLIKATRGIVYYNLKILENDGFITIKQPTVFILNEPKLSLIIERHKNKANFI